MMHLAVAAGAIVACSAAMAELVTLAKRVAALPRPMVLIGEPGVGKGLLARFIHLHSGRPGDFVAIGGGEASPPVLHPLSGDPVDAFPDGHARGRAPFER